MPNIRVKQALERISTELDRIGAHIVMYSGIDPDEARLIDNIATNIATTGAQIAGIARQVQGSNETPQGLVKKTRRALGFTSP